MPAKFSFVECDMDGEGKRWRLVVDAGEFLTLADEDWTVGRSDVIESGDQIIGPFTIEQLVGAATDLRLAPAPISGPHHSARSGVAHAQ